MTASIVSLATAFPAWRLNANAYIAAWGANAARGLQRKPFCGFDEDAISLGVAAGRAALSRLDQAPQIAALYLGSTTLPYEEKPASATVVTALFENHAVRTVEIRGSNQAGLQALLAAAEYCAAHPGAYAMAIASDAPQAAVDASIEHALAAGAAAFVVGTAPGVAEIGEDKSVTIETFGSRFRRNGERHLRDLELRLSEIGAAVRTLARFELGKIDRLAVGAAPDVTRPLEKAFGAASDGLWPQLGDTGAAGAPIALAHALETAATGETVLAAAVASGAVAVMLRRTNGPPLAPVLSVPQQLSGGSETDYIGYLKHRRMLGSTNAATS